MPTVLAMDALLLWTIILVGLTLVAVLLIGWQVKQGRDDSSRKDVEREGEAQRALDMAPIKLTGGRLRVPVAPATGPPAEPAIVFQLTGANAWIHEVLLSWCFRGEPMSPPTSCPPWEGEALPVLAQSGGRQLRFAWPGERAPRQAPIENVIRARCSIERNGPSRLVEVLIADTSWQ
jgi:hypothetical protein